MSRDEDTRSALARLFGPTVAADEDTLAECLSLVRLYALSPQDLYYKFEAFALSSLPPAARTAPSWNDMRALRQHLQNSSGAAMAAASTPMKKDPFQYPGTGAMSSARTGSSRKMLGLGGLRGAAGQDTPSRPSQSGRGANIMAGDANHDDSPSRHQKSQPAAESRPPWKVVQTLNGKLDASTSKLEQSGSGSSRVSLAVGTDPRKWQYRYMFERGGERGEALDDQLEAYSSLLVEAYRINEEDLGDPSHIHQQSVYVVGRVCPSLSAPASSKQAVQDATGGLPRLRPSHDSILLESSKLQGAGARVPVTFDKQCIIRRPPGSEEEHEEASGAGAAELLGIFPGMIVGLKGRNGGGDGFGVEEVLLLPSLYQSSTPPSRLLELQHSGNHLSGQPLNVAIASGPFTSESNLDFEPWHRLMDNLEREPVDVIVLMGPFVPLTHPLLPTSSLLPQDLFKRHFAARLNALTAHTSSRVAACTPILIPSVLDTLSSHAAWPQPKYDAAELGLTKKTKLLPNPCLFSINEVVLGVSTADALRDLRSEELVLRLKRQQPASKAGATPATTQQTQVQREDVLARAVRHILSQRSFYPVFPPPQPRAQGSLSSEGDAERTEDPLPLSLPHFDLALWPTVTPDVLILPSSLSPFAKIVDGTVVVNPGHVASASAAALPTPSAARLTAHPLPQSELQAQVQDGDEARPHDLWQRTRVDLLSL
ncbi:unnamed protein product [Parajaminaea phylloscopi]